MDISVSNAKDIIDNFLSLDNKYGWGRLAFMVDAGKCSKNIFIQVEQIQIVDMHHQAHGYFVLLGIGIVKIQFLPNPLEVSDIKPFANNVQ